MIKMNNKLKSYVNGLFADCPKTKKSQDLKEEILSNLSEHFNEAIKNGYTENDAYTEAISKLGNIDELLQSIMPDKDLAEKINAFKAKKAKITAISVILYIIGTAIFIGIPGVAALTHNKNIALCGIIGLITLLIFIAVATGLLIYVNMSTPQEIMPYIAEKEDQWIDKTSKNGALIGMINDISPILILVAYFIISFTTRAWNITWIIFLLNPVITAILKIIAKYDQD